MRTLTSVLAGAVLTAGLTACGGARQTPANVIEFPAGMSAADVAAAGGRQPYTEADVAFMQAMIHHHAQALVMSRMAPTHGAGPRLQTLAARIINSQKDEIRFMQQWLEERGEMAPDPLAADMHGGMHGGHGEAVLMTGMLSPEQLAKLDAARGFEFERLFLTYMIQHHKGAVTMVDELFATPYSGQEDVVFKLASDIAADQQSEIERMQDMLVDLIFGGGTH